MSELRVYPGDINTPYGLTKSLSIVNLRNLLGGNTFRIATEERKKEIRTNIHSSKHYIVYHEAIQGKRI